MLLFSLVLVMGFAVDYLFACLGVPLCHPKIPDADFNQKGTFLSDSLRGALPAGSKNKGITSTKPTVPRSTSQPGNCQREHKTWLCLIVKVPLFM